MNNRQIRIAKVFVFTKAIFKKILQTDPYLTDGLMPIDNNDVEQLMKRPPSAQKNRRWL